MNRGAKTLRRSLRKLRRSASKFGVRGVGHVRLQLFGRAANLRTVQRRVVLWTVLVFVLIGAAALQIVANRGAFTRVAAAPGGTYVEGSVGAIDTLDPILASTSSETSATRLLFSGLFDYDRTGALRPALATGYETADAKTYLVHLRPNAAWSDGVAFTSADVVFTFGLIENDAVRSPLAASFRNVTVTAVDAHTVRIVLPSANAPFINSLTFGMVPEHVLRSVDPGNIRASGFNLNPVTLGPFGLSSYRQSDANGNPAVYLSANDSYFGGAPKLDRFQLHAYKDQAGLLRAYERREVGAIAGASIATAQAATKNRAHTRVTNLPIDNGDYALFNTKGDLFADAGLRAAIRQGTDLTAVRKAVGAGVGDLQGPVLASEVPDVGALRQATGDVTGAKAALDALGWKVGSGGIRSKDGRPLLMRLVAIDAGGYPTVARELQRQYKALGVDVQLTLQPAATANEQVLLPRAFDMLVYELPIGADPDVYVYWDSTQSTGDGLNFSGYSSGVADDNLTSARAVLDPALRSAKYVAFVKQWLADTPAIALFQPTYHYVSGDDIAAIPTGSTLVTPTDRYGSVTDWTVDVARMYTTP